MIWSALMPRSLKRLESDEHIAGVQRSAEAAAIEGHHRIDGGIAFHCTRQGRHAAAHGLERGVLIGDDGAGDAPRVLLREEALGDDNIQRGGRGHGQQRH